MPAGWSQIAEIAHLGLGGIGTFGPLEFQGPSGALKNSRPCWAHARSARMASRFAQKVPLGNLYF